MSTAFVILVTILDAHNRRIKAYSFDFNEPAQRATFTEQANAALRAGQSVTTTPLTAPKESAA